MRARTDKPSNYRSVFDGYNTFRWTIDPTRDFGILSHPDIIDVSLGTACDGACPYCYVHASKNGKLYDSPAEKLETYFGGLNPEDLPYQIAVGGGGEPTQHPDFVRVLEVASKFGVLPNYTSNGMGVTGEIIEATVKLGCGVAITAHDHINWSPAVESLLSAGVKYVNVHVIVGQRGSIEKARKIRERYKKVDKIVLLPLYESGKNAESWEKISEIIKAADLLKGNPTGYAVGALYDKYISAYPKVFKDTELSVFDHEKFSGYLPLDSKPILRYSSYNTRRRLA